MLAKRVVYLTVVCALLAFWLQASAIPAVSFSPPPSTNPAPVRYFIHTATAANTDGPVTYLDHPLLNSSSNYYIFVMQNWNPPGSGGVYNDTPMGVWYSGLDPADPARQNRWAIFNEDGSNIPIGASFNIMFGDINSPAFMHVTSGDSALPYIVLDDPTINDDPNAILMISHYTGIGGIPTNFNHNLAVAWNPTAGRWWVVTEDNAGWPDHTKVLVMDVSDYDNYTFLHTTLSNVAGNSTWFYDPDSDAHPGALVFATHYLGSYGSGFIYYDHSLGVWYNPYNATGTWNIFSQDLTNMQTDIFFHLLVIPGDYVYMPLVSK